LLTDLIGHMGMEAKVTSEVKIEEGLRLNVDSEDGAILIGRKGQTLRSLQYLINRMLHENEAENGQRILIDVEGYIDRRKASLEEMALEMAAKAKETKRRVRMRPLTPQERRIIHVALQEDTDIRTFSVGNADVRTVVIAPKDELPDDRNRSRRGGRGGRDRNRDRNDRPPRDTETADEMASTDDETSAPVASEPQEAVSQDSNIEPAEVQAEPAEATTDPVEVEPVAAEVKAEEPVEAAPVVAESTPEPVEAVSEAAESEPEPVEAASEAVEVAPEPAVVEEPEPVEVPAAAQDPAPVAEDTPDGESASGRRRRRRSGGFRGSGAVLGDQASGDPKP
jgi:predicted RNA-binding protein YlqC (UPF0109 family)